MEQSIIERFKWWLCKKLGHFKRGDSWDWEGKTHYICGFCKCIISKANHD